MPYKGFCFVILAVYSSDPGSGPAELKRIAARGAVDAEGVTDAVEVGIKS